MYHQTRLEKLEEMKRTQSLPMDTLNNARELGGYVMKDGRTVKRGLLLRTTELAGASRKDLSLLSKDYQVRLILDMRGDHELKKAPDPQVEGAKWVNTQIIDFEAMRDLASLLQGHNEPKLDPNDPDAVLRSVSRLAGSGFFADAYKNYVASAFGQQGLRLFFREILFTEEGAVLWHCATGKDRTGLGSALLLAALGADYELILADYELSNLYFQKHAEEAEKRLHAIGCPPESLDMAVAVLAGVHAEFLNRAWEHILSIWGSAEGYLKEALGLNESDLELLKQRYLD